MYHIHNSLVASPLLTGTLTGCLVERSFATRMPCRLQQKLAHSVWPGRRRQSSPQRCYLHHLGTVSTYSFMAFPVPQIYIIGAMVIVWRVRGKIIRSVLCNIVCNNSSLDWVLLHWTHFTVLRFIFVHVLFCVSLYIACMCRTVTW